MVTRLSSVLTATGRSQPTGTRKEGSSGFPAETPCYRDPSAAKATVSPGPGQQPSPVSTVRVGKAPHQPGVSTQNSLPSSGSARHVSHARSATGSTLGTISSAADPGRARPRPDHRVRVRPSLWGARSLHAV